MIKNLAVYTWGRSDMQKKKNTKTGLLLQKEAFA